MNGRQGAGSPWFMKTGTNMPVSPEKVGRAFVWGGMKLAPGASLQDWLSGLGEAFTEAGIRTPLIDARLLLSHALGFSRGQLNRELGRPVGVEEAERISSLAERRLAREPVSRILGVRKFYGRTFDLSPGILDPRRDTETLVTLALDIARKGKLPEDDLRVLDLGVGAGAILLTLLAEFSRATGLGTDLSEECVAVSRANAVKLGVAERCRFQLANWLEGVSGSFHIVTANPPYMTGEAIAELAPEAGSYDPRLALDGGCDGLEAFRAITPALKNVLVPGGWVVFQVGEGQASAVEGMLSAYGFEVEDRAFCVRCDAFGVERAVAAKRPAPPR